MKRPRFNLKNPQPTHPCLILMRWSYPDGRGGHTLILLSSTYHVRLRNWDAIHMRCRERGPSARMLGRINDHLDHMEAACGDVYRKYGGGLPKETVKKLLRTCLHGEDKQTKTVLQLCDELIAEKRRSPDVRSAHLGIQKLRNQIDAWATYLSVAEVTDATAYDFRIYLFGKGYASSYIQKLMELFRSLLNYAKRMHVLDHNFWSGSPAWRQKDARPAKIALNPEEWKVMIAASIKDKDLEAARRLFVAQGLTGLRFSDVYTLNKCVSKDSPVGPVMEIIQKKTGKAVMIPAEELKEMNFLPLKRLHNQTYNRRLKRLGKALKLNRTIRIERLKLIRDRHGNYSQEVSYDTFPLFEVLASHAARRTWALTAYVNGVQLRYIQTVLGHASEKQTLHYIGMENLDPASLAMQALQDVKDKQSGLRAI